eukprot:UN0199
MLAPPSMLNCAAKRGLRQVSDELVEGLRGYLGPSNAGVFRVHEAVGEEALVALHMANRIRQRDGVEVANAVRGQQLEVEEELRLPGLQQAEEAQQQGPKDGPHGRSDLLYADVGRRNVHDLLQGEYRERDAVEDPEHHADDHVGGRELARESVAATPVVRGHHLGRIGEEDLHHQRGQHLDRKAKPAPLHHGRPGVHHECRQLQRQQDGATQQPECHRLALSDS